VNISTKEKSTEKDHLRFIILLAVVIMTIIVVVLIKRPDIIKKIWLWVIGLAAPIIAFFNKVVNSGASLLQKIYPDREKDKQTGIEGSLKKHQQEKRNLLYKIKELEKKLLENRPDLDLFEGSTLTVLRYYDDGQTTLGLMFVNEKFFCYTLEDTYREEKVSGRTRIPSGEYKIDFRKEETPLTLKYRETRDWFKYHIEIRDVPGFTGIYIHSGSNHSHTDGCLLVADSLYAGDDKKSIFNSRSTFEKIYKTIKPKLEKGEKMRIKIYDENWFDALVAKRKMTKT